MSDFPRPIPWLEGAGLVPSLDGPSLAAPSRAAAGGATSGAATGGGKRVHLPIVQSTSLARAGLSDTAGVAQKMRSKRTKLFGLFSQKPRPGSGLPARKVIVGAM